MARAHRLSGYDSDEEEDEFEELQEKIANNEDMVRKFYLFFLYSNKRKILLSPIQLYTSTE